MMALPAKNSCAVMLDAVHLKDNAVIVNASKSRQEKTPDFNLSLNTYDDSEKKSDPILDYISHYLLEEELDENISGYHEVALLQEYEKPFYEVLGEKYSPSPDKKLCAVQPKSGQRSITSLLDDQTLEKIITQNSIIDENILATEFKRGVEEGMKFLPTIHKLTVDLQVSRLSSDSQQKTDSTVVELKPEEQEKFGSMNRSRGKKNSSNADFDSFEGVNRKKPMIYCEEAITSDLFGKALLDDEESYEDEEVSVQQEIIIQQNANSCVGNKIQNEHVDLNTLLIHCSEAVSINNHRLAEELLMQIRKKSSPTGIGIQRFASFIADGLEARLAGSGSELYRNLVTKKFSATDKLKAYHFFITIAPFYKVSFCFANGYIHRTIKNSCKIHIVDLGTRFGLQWPPLIQCLASRQGGAPKLRITSIDFPQRGFYPSKGVKELGKRLEDYARSFNICFEYRGIALQWESICIDDLNIEKDEVLIVSSLFRFKEVPDDVSTVYSPSNQVLHLIRQMKPQLFIQGIYNAAFNPFFNTRFRQVLSCYSVFFDISDSLNIGENIQWQFIEREHLYPMIFNPIACEGSDWLERPETYKKWHRRNIQAGFEQLPLDPSVVNECKKRLRCGYDNRFFIEEDCNWVLQGWKGKVMYALSTWKPKAEL